MGNLLSCQKRVGNFVFLPDGGARPIESSMTVAELMLEHPSHFVAQLTSGKPVPLPADYKLEVEKTYVVLPMGTRKVGTRSKSPPNMMKDESSEGMDCQSEILLQRQYSKKGWKPSLRTIEEWALVKKVPHWLF
ncbi:uncharacterized protein LOC110031024 [Phalaenopsis equestris]|uniref:uncharacterized protein LOC110031024 n=1 Tax=Phalaenopsis equestris TaxID=78828 RepID=UPI0009E3595F|nr:uncharacterized protein LOC110031024 [Phalaenopsis equestris]